MDGYTVAKAAAANEKATKKAQAPPATQPPDKNEANASKKAGKAGHQYVALQLAPHESQAGGDPSQTTAVLQGLATDQAASPAHLADE